MKSSFSVSCYSFFCVPFFLCAVPQANFSTEVRLKVPRYLFHWTSASSLRVSHEKNLNKRKVPFKPIQKSTALADAFPIFAEHPGLFTWTHPITGMSYLPTHQTETYAISPNDSPLGPRLLILETDPISTSIELTSTSDRSMKDDQPESLNKIDFVHHKHFNYYYEDLQDGLLYEEWIVLNRNKIRCFTADTHQLRDWLEKEISLFTQPGFQYHETQLFSKEPLWRDSEAVSEFVYPLIRKYLDSGNVGIPDELINNCNITLNGNGAIE